ncbi:MAG: hypothetical protein Q8O84_04710 [Nanoarchaeota archaeon]|nr:hypothetical protein [Nanoarchaeota archaeon]
MAPLIEVSNEVLKGLNQLKIPYNLKEKSNGKQDSGDFIYVPSINLYFAKERKFLGENWFNSHKKLQENGERMPTIPEFVELLKYSKENDKKLYNEITKVRSPWRAEWLDANFKVKDKELYINYNHVLDKNGNLIPKNSEILDENTLMSDKTPGISLDDFVEGKNITNQGLPNKKIESGNLYYWHPRSDNNSVAWFGADDDWAFLNGSRIPSYTDSSLGVRAVRQ